MTLNWGILASGRIAHTFAAAITATPGNSLVAVASRSAEKARDFASQHGNIRAHGSYEALIEDVEVDVIYIATPHPQHAPWCIRALRAGKHVLCEKPLGVNHAEVMAMTHAAATAGRFLMEAFMYRCHPQTRIVGHLVADGAIGEVRQIQANFGYNTPFNAGSRLFANALAGGGILDVGCYPVSLARWVMGEEPAAVRAHGHLGTTGVDEWSQALLCFGKGVSAQVGTSIRVGLDNSARISGDCGYIRMPNPWLPADKDGRWSFELSRNGHTEAISGIGKSLYVLEVEAVTAAIAAGRLESEAMSWQDSIGNARTLDAWRAEIGLEYAAEAPATHRGPLFALPGRTDATAPIGRAIVTGLDTPMARLVMGCDNQPNASHAAVMWDRYFEQGGNAFDTAFVYGSGSMEKLLGHWHRQRSVRDRMVIIGKGAHTPHNFPEQIGPQLDVSLDRLQTDYVDVYFLHRDNTDVPVGEFVDALNAEVARGRIRVFGGSNWTLPRVQAANAYARERGLHGFAAVSNNYSLARMVERIWPGVEAASDPEYRRYLEENQLALMPWSSQARGFFTPWVDEVLASQGARTKGFTRVEPTIEELTRTWFAEDNFERRRRAIGLGRRYGTSAINIALAWVLGQSFPVFALIGPRTLAELDSCIRALSLDLTPTEMKWLNLETEHP